MQAMILAAGLGTRLWPLTRTVPKPMVLLAGRPLLQYQVERLVHLGCSHIVVNHARHGKLIEEFLGDGSRFNTRIVYSAEGEEPLGTAAGVRHALPLLTEEDFMLVSADAICDYPRLSLPDRNLSAHLLVVPTQRHHPQGDFFIKDGYIGYILTRSGEPCVYSGIGLFRAGLFTATKEPDIASVLRSAEGTVSGQWHQGYWMDVGTPECLQEAERYFQSIRHKGPDRRG